MRMAGRNPQVATDKAKNTKETYKKLMKYLKQYNLAFILVIFLAAASATFGIFGPSLLGDATTLIYEGIMGKFMGTATGINFTGVAKILKLLLILYGASALLSYIQGFIMSTISMRVSYNMRNDISIKLNKMPLNYFDTTNHGEILSRVTNDVDTVSRTLNQSIGQIITSVATIIGVFIMMIRISILMTVVAVVMIPISLISVILIVKRSQKYFKRQQDYLGHVNGHIEEMYSGHLVIKAFNGEEKSEEEFAKLNNTLYLTAWKAQFLSGLMMPITKIIGNIGYVVISVLGGALAANGTIAVGQILAFVQYIRNFNQPISQMANVSSVLQQAAAAAERVFDFLSEENEVPDTSNPVYKDKIEGLVMFKHVKFGYVPDKTIVKDFSAVIRPGQKVAIVGPTGAGKTTMVKLLMRFYDINSGVIKIDGVDIKQFTRDYLRDQFGMVLQDTWLYNGSIMDNIRYGRLDATDEEVYVAAKAAHVDSFVKMLPGGYNMELNEEATNVSQGQKQLITIARAILSEPKLLILDEATSSVDTKTEVQIQKAMNRLMEGKTSFIIAHRLSTIKDADVILVMNEGDIVEQGNHNELLAKGGFYANLYNSQFDDSNSA